MAEVPLRAVEPVVADLVRSGLEAPKFDGVDWMGDPMYAASMMWSADGSGSGLSVRRAAHLAERVAEAADQIQEWVIEGQLWGAAPTNWPRCPLHPLTHPLQVRVAGASPVWACPADGSVVALIGSYQG